jgi:spore cortex formation protein SpoVR/YcgB (stage V sporulation)
MNDTPSRRPRAAQPLFEGAEWTFALMREVHAAVQDIALDDLGLDVFPNQIEVISAEQMLDAYSSVGMPLMYSHWSFGKRFVRDEMLYRKGYQALAYEIVINSNPCISYYMEENSMAMQTLVLAHAAFGHNHFFKNNYLFQQWTDPNGILDYLEFAKRYVAECEEKHGQEAVESVLDAAHALQNQSVFRYRRANKLKLSDYEARRRERLANEQAAYSDLWRTVPNMSKSKEPTQAEKEAADRMLRHRLPEENLLYFLEKMSPILQPWQRELLRIVRNVSQYFYPQRQTKLMNEGCATFVHYHIINELYDRGLISEGALLEILHSHSNVVYQTGFDHPHHGGMNPYALGFAMMQDIQRICVAPTDEDREWFPDLAGREDWRGALKEIWASYRDESFVRQFLSPHLIRKFKLFLLSDKAAESEYAIDAIHDAEGYRRVRNALADTYDVAARDPDIQVVDVDLLGDRKLILKHRRRQKVPLAEGDRDRVMRHVKRLWGYDAVLQEEDAAG